jgi:hypothetical protein
MDCQFDEYVFSTPCQWWIDYATLLDVGTFATLRLGWVLGGEQKLWCRTITLQYPEGMLSLTCLSRVFRYSPAAVDGFPPGLHASHLPHFISAFQASSLVPTVLGAPAPRSCALYGSPVTCARNLVPVARGGAGCTCVAGRNERPLVGDWVGGMRVEETPTRRGQQVFGSCA